MPIFMELLIDFIVGLDVVEWKRKKNSKNHFPQRNRRTTKGKKKHDDYDDVICLLLLNCIYFCVFMEISLSYKMGKKRKDISQTNVISGYTEML